MVPTLWAISSLDNTQNYQENIFKRVKTYKSLPSFHTFNGGRVMAISLDTTTELQNSPLEGEYIFDEALVLRLRNGSR